MAKTKRSAAKKPASDPLSRLRANMRRLQNDAEKLLSRTRKQAASLISRDQKQAINRLVGQAKKLRADLEKRAKRAQQEVETRAEEMLSGIESQLAKGVEPVLRRLDVPSRTEIRSLGRRIAQLEKHLKERSRPAAPPSTARESGGALSGE